MKKTYYLLLLVALAGLLSCGETPCARTVLHTRLIDFTDAEADTIVLRRLNKNQNTIIDSFVFDINNPVRFTRFGDTLIPVSYPATLLMQSDFDYELFVPAANRTFRITELTEEQTYIKKGLFGSTKEACVNPLTGVKVDGQPVTAIQFPNTIYLRK